MLIFSSLLVWAVIQFRISGSQTNAHHIEDRPLCLYVSVEKCQEPIVKSHCFNLCNKDPDLELCKYITTDMCQEVKVLAECPNKCNPPSIECPSPWSIVGNQCFRVDDNHSVKHNWTSARTYCSEQATGGDLAQPNDIDALASYMVNHGFDNSSSRYWLGGDKFATDGEWFWLDGTIITSNVQDTSYLPSKGSFKERDSAGDGVEDCLILLPGFIGLAGEDCGADRPFVCEAPADIPTSPSEDPPMCRYVDFEKCQDTFIKEECSSVCSKKKDPEICQYIKTDRCQEVDIMAECPYMCNLQPIECPSPWFRVDKQCFRVDDIQHNWMTARSYCGEQATGGDLAQPNNITALAEYMVKNGLDNRNDKYWLGGEEDVWRWLDRTIITHNVIGTRDEHESNCLLFWLGNGDYDLASVNCYTARPFVCERYLV